MSSAPPLPPPRKKGGCAGCLLTGLIVFVLLVGAIIGSSYYIVAHTSLPLQWAGRAILGPEFKITGASGSASSGYTIQSVHWRNSRGELCEIEDIRFKSTGWTELTKDSKLIISDLNIGKAHIYLAPLNSKTNVQWNDNSQSSSSTPAPSPHRGIDTANLPKLFRIDRIHLNDIYVKDDSSGFEFSMPNLDYAGFKAENGQIDLGTLHIESDRLDVQTEPGRSLTVEGQPVVFQKYLTGTLKPLLSKSIKRPIDFALDVGVTEQHQLFCHLIAFNQTLEVFVDKDRSESVHAKNLPLASYLSFAPYDAPELVTLDGKVSADVEADPAKITPPTGNIRIGATDFPLDSDRVDVQQNDGKYRYQINATNRTGKTDLIASLKLQSEEPRVRLAFGSKPAMPPREILSRIFFNRNFSELQPSEQKQIEDRIPVYFPPESDASAGS